MDDFSISEAAVERLTFWRDCSGDCCCDVGPEKLGAYVRFDDYDKLRSALTLAESKLAASEASEATLRRLWNADCDDIDKLLERLGLGDKATVQQECRSEGGFLRVGRVYSAILAKAAQDEWRDVPLETET